MTCHLFLALRCFCIDVCYNWCCHARPELPLGGVKNLAEVKATDDHAVVLWINLPTCGVVSAPKYDFFLTAATTFLQTFKKNGLAIFIHCNRASEGRTNVLFFKAFPCCVSLCTLQLFGRSNHKRLKTEPKVEKEEDGDFAGAKEETKEENDDDGEGSKAPEGTDVKEHPEEADIRIMKHNLEQLDISLFESENVPRKALALKDRNLWLKDLTWIFAEDAQPLMSCAFL